MEQTFQNSLATEPLPDEQFLDRFNLIFDQITSRSEGKIEAPCELLPYDHLIMGLVHYHGLGTEVNYHTAKKCFELAILDTCRFNSLAYYMVGLMAERGHGGDIDVNVAAKYYSSALDASELNMDPNIILTAMDITELKEDADYPPLNLDKLTPTLKPYIHYIYAKRTQHLETCRVNPALIGDAEAAYNMVAVDDLDDDTQLQYLILASNLGFALANIRIGGMLEPDMALKFYLAAGNHPHAHNMIGYLHEHDFDNRERAIKYYQRAVDGGHSIAAYNLGTIYYRCDEPNYELAKHYFELSADPSAQFYLGQIHHYGLGGPIDLETAAKYYTAVGDDAEAYNQLGVIAFDSKDYNTALMYFHKSGTDDANENLGCMYAEGYGCERDFVQSLHHYQLSGSPVGYVGMAMLHFDDTHGQLDHGKAIEYLKKAGDHPLALAALTLIHQSNVGGNIADSIVDNVSESGEV